MHVVNIFSDHAPLSFSLYCNHKTVDQLPFTETKLKWDDSSRNQFRSGIISNLPMFNRIVEDLDCSSCGSIKSALNKFNDVIRNVADPLFSKEYLITNTPKFEQCSAVRHANWFDLECKTAHGRYVFLLKTI